MPAGATKQKTVPTLSLLERCQSFFSTCRQFGPGIITGTANDDPSCILTFLIAGAQFGYHTLWLSLYCLPLLVCLQVLCSRLAIAGGKGLTYDIGLTLPKAMAWSAAGLVVANTITIAADLSALAEVTRGLTGIPFHLAAALFVIGIGALLLLVRFRHIETVLKWVCLLVLTYVASALVSRPDWHAVWRHTLVPSLLSDRNYYLAVVGLGGATFSPFFLFWQASHQAEHEGLALSKRQVKASDPKRETISFWDALSGSFISRLITFAITVTATATLYRAGQHSIETAQQAAQTLTPIAGKGASILFSLALIATGLMALPVLSASSAYAIGDALKLRPSLEQSPRRKPPFYAVLISCLLGGWLLLLLPVNRLQISFAASVANGLYGIVSVFFLLYVTSKPVVMGSRVGLRDPVTRTLRAGAWITGGLLLAGGIGAIGMEISRRLHS